MAETLRRLLNRTDTAGDLPSAPRAMLAPLLPSYPGSS
jgi:hypothetical protein